MPAWVSLASDDNRYPHEGKLSTSSTTRSTPARGPSRCAPSFPIPPVGGGPRLFTPGLFGAVKVPVSQSFKRLLVVDRAVSSDLNEKFVYIVDAKDVVERRPVKLGALEKGLRVIVPVPVVKAEKGWRPAREGEKGEDSLARGGPGDRQRLAAGLPGGVGAGERGQDGRRRRRRSVGPPDPRTGRAGSDCANKEPCVMSHFFIDRPIFATVLSIVIVTRRRRRRLHPAGRPVPGDRAADRVR